MTSTVVPVTTTPPLVPQEPMTSRARTKLSRPWASATALVLALLWTLPTFGLAVSSIRPARDTRTSGW